MKLRIVLALISLAIACGAIAIKASTQTTASATPAPAPAAASNATCPDCDGPDPAAVLPNPYKTDAAKPVAATSAAPATQAVPTFPTKN
jgi:hypothetical protein